MIERLARDVQEWFRSISIVDAADDGRVVSCSGNFRVPRGGKIEKDDNTRLSRGLTDPGEGREGGEEDVYSQFEAPLGGEKQKFAFLSFADGVTLCSLSVWRSLGFCTAKAVCFAPPLTRTRDILVGRYPAASRKLPKSDGGLPLLPRDL